MCGLVKMEVFVMCGGGDGGMVSVVLCVCAGVCSGGVCCVCVCVDVCVYTRACECSRVAIQLVSNKLCS